MIQAITGALKQSSIISVIFLLNKNGDLVIGLNAPDIFKESLKNLQDYWNVTQK